MEGRVEGGRIEQKGERTHGHGQQCGGYGERGVRGLHGKNTIK